MHNVEITSNILKEFFSLFRSKKTDLIFIFRVWSDCIDRSYELGQEIGPKHFRFEFLSADLYGLVADDLPPMSDVNIDAFANRNFTFPEVNQFDVEGKPDYGVLQRLESELGFRISGLDVQENNFKEERLVSTVKQKKKKKKRKRDPNREKSKTGNQFLQKFVSDDTVDAIKDLEKKSSRFSYSSSESEKEEVKEGKRRIKKTWKLRLRENLTKKKKKRKSASSCSTEREDPIKEEEISSDDFVPS
jgi:hypothetical protein